MSSKASHIHLAYFLQLGVRKKPEKLHPAEISMGMLKHELHSRELLFTALSCVCMSVCWAPLNMLKISSKCFLTYLYDERDYIMCFRFHPLLSMQVHAWVRYALCALIDVLVVFCSRELGWFLPPLFCQWCCFLWMRFRVEWKAKGLHCLPLKNPIAFRSQTTQEREGFLDSWAAKPRWGLCGERKWEVSISISQGRRFVPQLFLLC